MTTKEYLRQIYNAKRRIRSLMQRREAIEAELYTAKSPNLSGDHVRSSRHPDDALIRLIDKCERMTTGIAAEIERLEDLRRKISAQIDQIEDEKCRQVLVERYELCNTWETIAENMDISVRHVYRLHGIAISEFRNKFR